MRFAPLRVSASRPPSNLHETVADLFAAAQIRVARPSRNYREVVAFYSVTLGFPVLAEWEGPWRLRRHRRRASRREPSARDPVGRGSRTGADERGSTRFLPRVGGAGRCGSGASRRCGSRAATFAELVLAGNGRALLRRPGWLLADSLARRLVAGGFAKRAPDPATGATAFRRRGERTGLARPSRRYRARRRRSRS